MGVCGPLAAGTLWLFMLPMTASAQAADAGRTLIFTVWLTATVSTLAALFPGEIMGLHRCVLVYFRLPALKAGDKACHR